jgi:hypothetical protein
MDTQELIQMVSTVLASEKQGILYRPEMTRAVGGVTSAILLQQMVYWWQRSEFGPFYKFKEPCESALYRPGDSWCEELGFSRAEFDTAIKRIGVKKTKGVTIAEAAKQSSEEEKPIIYWITPGRVSYYTINPVVLLKILKDAYLPKSENQAIPKETFQPYVDTESSPTISETTRNHPEKGVPEILASDDCADLWEEVANRPEQESSPAIKQTDWLPHLADYYKRTQGKPSWTEPAAAGGADPYLDGPLTAACTILRITPEALTEKEQREHATIIRDIAEKVKGGTPELFTQACREWFKHGPTWKGKKGTPYSGIHSDGLCDDIRILMRQITSGTIGKASNGWSKTY